MKDIQNIIPFTQNNLWGLVDADESIIANPLYDSIEKPTSEDGYPDAFFIVSHKDKYFFIDSTGERVSDIVDYNKIDFMMSIKDGESKYNYLQDTFSCMSNDENANKNDYIFPIPSLGKISYFTNSGKCISPKLFDLDYSAIRFKNYKEVNKDGNTGVIDENGNYVIEPIYQEVMMRDDIVHLTRDNKHGVSDIKHNIIIPIIYEEICFSGHLYIVKQDKYALFDKHGKQLTDFIYSELEDVRDGKYFIYKINEKYGVLNNKLETVFLDIYDEILPDVVLDKYKEDRWVVVIDGIQNVIDLKSNIIYKLPYVRRNYCSGKATNYLYGLDGYIAEEHNKLVLHTTTQSKEYTCVYDSFIYSQPEDALGVNILFINTGSLISKNEKEGFINLDSNYIQDAIFDEIYRFHADYFNVTKANKHGLIDFNGNYIMEPIYDESVSLDDKYNLLSIDKKYGIIDKEQNVILEFNYDFIKIMNDSVVATIAGTVYIINLLTKEIGFEQSKSKVKIFNEYIIIYDECKSTMYQLTDNILNKKK
jgi:hypothetical protein